MARVSWIMYAILLLLTDVSLFFGQHLILYWFLMLSTQQCPDVHSLRKNFRRNRRKRRETHLPSHGPLFSLPSPTTSHSDVITPEDSASTLSTASRLHGAGNDQRTLGFGCPTKYGGRRSFHAGGRIYALLAARYPSPATRGALAAALPATESPRYEHGHGHEHGRRDAAVWVDARGEPNSYASRT